ncbi:winged helix-turn-helix domain-containing protein, partial [Nocardiopsis sp. MG754419]|uniref:winged helix-turn-helix domain-containing protein n=1 Tax=Nocardiopsis sp. MG754419 TaxID=2259865 RepID=UPI001BA9D6A8
PTPRRAGHPTREEVLAAWETQQAHNATRQGGHTVDDQHEHHSPEASEPSSVSRGVKQAQQARKATGRANLTRVASHVKDHPGQSVPEIAEALDLSPATIKRHLRSLRGGDG